MISCVIFQVFFTMSPGPDLDLWDQLTVPVTHSAELQNLERHAEYAIAVAAKTASVGVAVNKLVSSFYLHFIFIPVDV